MAVTKIPLSASTHGRAVLVAATSIAAGTTVHTASSGTSNGTGDVLFLMVSNTSTAPVTLTLGWGGVVDPNDLIVDAWPVPPGTPPLWIVKGLILRNSLVIRAAGGSANVLLIEGWADRYS
jgi:hypothetical protein